MGKLLRQRVVEEFPQRHQRQEIRALVAKLEMGLVRRLLAFQRPLARIGYGQRTGDHERLGQAARVARGKNNAADARVERKTRELATEWCEAPVAIERYKFLQELIPVGDRPGAGGSTNGNASAAPSSSAAIRRITAASDERRISGSVNFGRARNRPHRSRTQMPSATRPQRPAR
jgi:hypothetical protein